MANLKGFYTGKRRQQPAKTEGWWWPDNCQKRHYMREGRSLCGKWGCYGRVTVFVEAGDDSPMNCKECAKRLARPEPCVCDPKRRADQIRINPYCKAKHA